MWEPMQIARERVLHVMEAPKLPLASHLDQESLLELLIWVTEGVQALILEILVIDAEEASARKIKERFNAFQAELSAFPGATGRQPPKLPTEWESEMNEWTLRMNPLPRLGNPGRQQRNALLLLCSYYRLAFGREPKANGKPTRDFINEWFREFGEEMQNATDRVRPKDQRKLRVWAPHKDEALRKALQETLSEPADDKELRSRYHEIKFFRDCKETSRPNDT